MMNWTGAIALYFIIWWLTLFAILPLGVRSQDEAGDVVPGSEIGAPVKARMGYKVVLTTLVSVPIFLLVWYGLAYFPW